MIVCRSLHGEFSHTKPEVNPLSERYISCYTFPDNTTLSVCFLLRLTALVSYATETAFRSSEANLQILLFSYVLGRTMMRQVLI